MVILGSNVPIPVLWFFAAIVLGVVALMTIKHTSLWLAGGAVAGGIASFFTDSFLNQGVVFLAVSVVLLIVARPILTRKRKS